MFNVVSKLIPLAIELRPGLKEKLEFQEISKAKHAVDLIKNQEGLQTSGVIASIRMLQSQGDILKKSLVSLDDEGKSSPLC